MRFRLSFRALTAALIFTIPSIYAVHAEEYRGGGYFTDWEGCEAIGWAGVEPVQVRVRPAGLGNNDPDQTSVSFFFGTGAVNFYGPMNNDEIVYVDQVSVWGFAWTEGQMGIRGMRGAPADLESLPDVAFYEFEITDFGGPGCNARAAVAMARR
ncbi:hypothetical protein LCM17_05060 [Cereibacter sphaeroides]|nr:hypothetical protein [Cereibacter sphaeroides]